MREIRALSSCQPRPDRKSAGIGEGRRMTTSEMTKTKIASPKIRRRKICARLEPSAPAKPFDLLRSARRPCLSNSSIAPAAATLNVAGAGDNAGLSSGGFDPFTSEFSCDPSCCEIQDGSSCWLAGEEAASEPDSDAVSLGAVLSI